MKTRFFWCCCLAGMAMAIGLIPLTAQDTFDALDEPDPAAQRERDDARSAMSTVKRRYGVASQPNNTQVPTAFTQHPAAFAPQPNNFSVAGTGNLFSSQNRFAQFTPELAKQINESHGEIAELIKELKASDADDEKQEIKSKIKSELDIQYDAYLTHHEKPLTELEERLAKLREEFEARKKAKDDLVKLRLDTIWYDSLGLGWPNSRQLNTFFHPPGALSITTAAEIPRGYAPTATPTLPKDPSGLFPPTAVTTPDATRRPSRKER